MSPVQGTKGDDDGDLGKVMLMKEQKTVEWSQKQFQWPSQERSPGC